MLAPGGLHRPAIPAMGERAILLLRNLYHLIEEEIAEHEGEREQSYENGQSPVGHGT